MKTLNDVNVSVMNSVKNSISDPVCVWDSRRALLKNSVWLFVRDSVYSPIQVLVWRSLRGSIFKRLYLYGNM